MSVAQRVSPRPRARVFLVRCKKCGAEWTTKAWSIQDAITKYQHYITCPAGMHIAIPSLAKYSVVVREENISLTT